jgi:hypothetical protein
MHWRLSIHRTVNTLAPILAGLGETGMSFEDFNALRHINEDEALRFVAHERLVQEARAAHPHGLRHDLGQALVRLGRWIEGRQTDDALADDKARYN